MNMKNSEILKLILEKLEKEHKNLYHDVSKQKVLSYIHSIKNIDQLSESQFDMQMMRLFHLFKDGHTSYLIRHYFIDKLIIYKNKKVYIKDGKIFKQVKSIADENIKQVCKEIKSMLSFETNEWCNYLLSDTLNDGYVYEMLGLLNKNKEIEFKTIEDETIFAKVVAKIGSNEDAPQKIKPKKIPYSYQILNGNILYFKYRRCHEEKTYPFSDFVLDMKSDIEKFKIKKYILDLRGNFGGNSEIINPFQKLVSNKKMKGVLLTDNKTFSSGRFALARFKQKFKTPIVGETAGGAAKSFGQAKKLEVENKHFTASTKFWDFSKIFGYCGAIKPDFKISNSIKDLETGNDRQLKKAIKVVNEL